MVFAKHSCIYLLVKIYTKIVLLFLLNIAALLRMYPNPKTYLSDQSAPVAQC